jgi:hypothetical protein
MLSSHSSPRIVAEVPQRAAGMRRGWKQLVGPAVGLVVLGAVAHFVGTGSVRAALSRNLPWLPLLLVLEATRIPIELWASVRLLGPHGTRVPLAGLLRAHLVFYAMSIGVPGGRPVAEAAKAKALAPSIGGARAAALSTASQSMSFTTDALFALLAAVAAFRVSGRSSLTLALALLAFGCVVLSTAVAHGARSAWLGRAFQRFPRLSARLRRFRETAERQAMLSADVVAIFGLSRVAQVSLFGVLFHATLGQSSLDQALVALGLAMLGSVVGDAIPGQLGATDAVFTLAAAPLGNAAADLTSMALVFHAAQLLVTATAAILALSCFRNVATPSPASPTPSP